MSAAPTSAAREWNFDGLVGPSHNHAGLSFGNVASAASSHGVSNPRAAALQGLVTMHALARQGFAQALLPPHLRPDFSLLHAAGFRGNDAAILAAAQRDAPVLLAAAYSASAMWTANAATVSPAADTADGRTHFTVANLNSKLHRSREPAQTQRILQAIFADPAYFKVHPALPATSAFSDEGAANHARLCATHDSPGLELFVYGRSEFDGAMSAPARFPARQTIEAGQAIARLHQLAPQRSLFVQQNPDVIDQGVFHNDVISVANENVLFHHEHAFADEARSLGRMRDACDALGFSLRPIRVPAAAVSVGDAVGSYLFNSQLLTRNDGGMTLVVPQECEETPAVARFLRELIASGGPIDRLCAFDLRQSMRNGGGPACLRLRVVLSIEQAAAMHQGVILTDALHARLVAWVERHYRDRLHPADLADPALAREIATAHDALSEILGLAGLYDRITATPL